MSNAKTIIQYKDIVAKCKNIFISKNCDYGSSWHVLRLPSITDQISIKAWRIRSVTEKNLNLVGDPIEDDYRGIVNYCIMALLKIEYVWNQKPFDNSEISIMYDEVFERIISLLQKKNHDYDEAWRMLRLSSIIDLILVKLMRIKHIEENTNELVCSEDVDSNYRDIVNYAIFSLIRLEESKI